MRKSFKITTSTVYPLGVRFVPEGLHIAAVCEENTECGIFLYDKKHKDGIKIPFPKENRKGNIYSMLLHGYQDRSFSYLFYRGEELFQDPYALALEDGRKYKYGEKKEIPSRCKVLDHTYNWNGDKDLTIPFEDSIFYLLHVRGFTKHRSSGVRCKGTYLGIVEKIPYLKELGITAVILMPSYEFDEILHEERQPMSMEQAMTFYMKSVDEPDKSGKESVRINYWGYQPGLYFLPKYAYSYNKDAVTEFKDMVKSLHQNGVEVMMQFYFPPEIGYMKMLEILKYWVLEYHIDGFHLMGIDIPMHMIRREPLFAETKLLCEKDDYFNRNGTETGWDEKACEYRNFGFMNEAFLYDIRKILKGDANMVERLIYLCRENAVDKGIVNYIAKQDGFRLYDLVSYARKHNEANGEFNQDGNSYNYSWNCGIEGKTRKKSILALRIRQMKNAMTFVMLSQGTPLIYSGDEFGNSQEGNNNPYCQDNSICWIKWNLLKTNEEFFAYTKDLIALRKAQPILHMSAPLRGMDYLSCGYPDISFHGKEAWKPDTGAESRSLGIMYCGSYGGSFDKTGAFCFYIGINMHWKPYSFGLPQMPKGKEWVRLFSTASQEEEMTEKEEAEEEVFQNILVPPRTIAVYITRRECEK